MAYTYPPFWYTIASPIESRDKLSIQVYFQKDFNCFFSSLLKLPSLPLSLNATLNE